MIVPGTDVDLEVENEDAPVREIEAVGQDLVNVERDQGHENAGEGTGCIILCLLTLKIKSNRFCTRSVLHLQLL